MRKVLIDMPVPEAGFASQVQRPEGFALDLVGERTAEAGREIPVERLREAEVLFSDRVSDYLAATDPGERIALRWMQIPSVGYNHLAGLGLADRGIRLSNARGVFDVPIAEWNIAMMINLLRDLPGMLGNQREGKWDRAARFQTELRGATVGLWGYGGIGRETARLAKAMGLTVHAMTRSGTAVDRTDPFRIPGTGDPGARLPDRFFRPGEKEEFLAGLDFLILTLPLSPATEGLIGEKELAALPESAFLLNPARGPLVDEEALLDALREKRIAGAALDAHYRYPVPGDDPLWHLPNTIVTPHIAGSSESTHFLGRIWEIFGKNLERYAEGRALLNEVAPEKL